MAAESGTAIAKPSGLGVSRQCPYSRLPCSSLRTGSFEVSSFSTSVVGFLGSTLLGELPVLAALAPTLLGDSPVLASSTLIGELPVLAALAPTLLGDSPVLASSTLALRAASTLLDELSGGGPPSATSVDGRETSAAVGLALI
jgi:hypothetical protein